MDPIRTTVDARLLKIENHDWWMDPIRTTVDARLLKIMVGWMDSLKLSTKSTVLVGREKRKSDTTCFSSFCD
jgi:hypothetical protein